MRENPPPQGKQLGYQPFVFDGRAHITTQLSRIGRSRSFGQTIHMWVVLQAFPKAAHIEDMGGFVKLTKIPPDIRTEAAIKLPVKGCLLDVTRH